MNIIFRKVTVDDVKVIYRWLDDPVVKAFWDNSEAHRNDIMHFAQGRRTPSPYFEGRFAYWLGGVDEVPFCMMMTLQEREKESRPEIKAAHLSMQGATYSLDFMVGNAQYRGKGLADKAINAFIDYFTQEVDPQADTFFIDPEVTNTKAKHVYEKAGFQLVGDFVVQEGGGLAGKTAHFMVKRL